MTEMLNIKRLITLFALTATWCGLWRDISIANIAAGAVISIGILALGAGTGDEGTVHLVPLAKLVWLVMIDLAKSTVAVASEVITPTDYTNESVVAVTLPRESRDHQLLLVVAITLTPGTAVVDADRDTGTLYLHLLHHEGRAETVKHVMKLARLAGEALPSKPVEVTS
ncbi:MAG: Na+/H+ antiporter subunit E [Acidimicrobiales bacterium]